VDLYVDVIEKGHMQAAGRDEAIAAVITKARAFIRERYDMAAICGAISAGGGTGTHIGTGIMRALPMGVPKVMVSTVASRDMSESVGTKDITMMHSVVDLLGVNSISGGVLFRAAGAVCGMALSRWRPKQQKKRIALSMFGFITEGAERLRMSLEDRNYEVIAFHANGTGGMAMEELAGEGLFDGILDFATHELADELKQGYCRGIGPQRLMPVPGKAVPRLVVPGGLDCAVLEFTRDTIPEEYRDRKIFFYDFRSAVRLDEEETRFIADQLAEKLNRAPALNKVLIPMKGWSEADGTGAPLYDPDMRDLFLNCLKEQASSELDIKELDLHINDEAFARAAAEKMDEMVRESPEGQRS
jgi:uncharacterized protein (UPF0261 family)